MLIREVKRHLIKSILIGYNAWDKIERSKKDSLQVPVEKAKAVSG